MPRILLGLILLAACAPPPPELQPVRPSAHRVVLQSCDDGGSGGVLINGVCL